jgi:hypothetical protein
MTVCHLWSPKKNLKYCPGLVDHYSLSSRVTIASGSLVKAAGAGDLPMDTNVQCPDFGRGMFCCLLMAVITFASILQAACGRGQLIGHRATRGRDTLGASGRNVLFYHPKTGEREAFVSNSSISQLLPADKFVTLREFLRNPTRCFQDAPVAVVSKGNSVGYLLSPELFENLTLLMAQTVDPVSLKEKLNLSSAWLEKVAGGSDV